MKLASYFLISIAFHAAILTLPVSFFEAGGERVVPVVLYGPAEGDGQEPAGTSRVEKGRGKSGPGVSPRHHARMERSGDQSVNRTSQSEETAMAEHPVPMLAQDVSGEGVIVAGLSKTGVEELGGLSPDGVAEGGRGGESGGMGNSEIGMGPERQGEGGGYPGAAFAQANYVHNPKPEYPERARREGWEGTVLLQVLVDQEGKSKWVEVSRSSGFESLDGAALEAVKRWRFHPARYGEKRVESWVKIPIIFRLADLKN